MTRQMNVPRRPCSSVGRIWDRCRLFTKNGGSQEWSNFAYFTLNYVLAECPGYESALKRENVVFLEKNKIKSIRCETFMVFRMKILKWLDVETDSGGILKTSTWIEIRVMLFRSRANKGQIDRATSVQMLSTAVQLYEKSDLKKVQ